MKPFSIILMFVFSCIFCVNRASAQEEVDYVIYDLIYLEKGGVLKGEILSYDEVMGGISFRDTRGTMYSLGRDEYKYFRENERFAKKQKEKTIKPRKENEMALFMGFGFAMLNLNHNFIPDSYYLNGVDSEGDLAMSLQFSAGKYVNRQNFIGLGTEFTLAAYNTNFFNIGARYIRQYDAYKRNVAFYIPLELKYNAINFSSTFQVSDTLYDNQGGWSYPSDLNVEYAMNTLQLTVGHGVSFILDNKKSVDVELIFNKHFLLSNKFQQTIAAQPNSSFDITGLKLSVLYSL